MMKPPESAAPGIPFKESTDVPFYDSLLKSPEYAESKGYKVHVVHMSPDAYIAQSAKMQGTSISRQVEMVQQDLLDKYVDDMAKGVKYDLPYFDFRLETQEGRARVLAAKKLGYDKIPVLIADDIAKPKFLTPKPTSTGEEGKPVPPGVLKDYPDLAKSNREDKRLLKVAIEREPLSVAKQLGYEVHRLSPKDVVDKDDYARGYRYRLSKADPTQPYPQIVMARSEGEIATFLKRQTEGGSSSNPEVVLNRDRRLSRVSYNDAYQAWDVGIFIKEPKYGGGFTYGSRVLRRFFDTKDKAQAWVDEYMSLEYGEVPKEGNPVGNQDEIEFYKNYRIKKTILQGRPEWWVLDPGDKFFGVYFSETEAKRAVDTAKTMPDKPTSMEEGGEPVGTCYEDAWRFVIKEEEGELIHGAVESKGKRIGHAWVELPTGFIWEPETGKYFTREAFNIAASPIEDHRYTVEEAAIMLARVGKHGPWTEEERLQILGGNPTAGDLITETPAIPLLRPEMSPIEESRAILEGTKLVGLQGEGIYALGFPGHRLPKELGSRVEKGGEYVFLKSRAKEANLVIDKIEDAYRKMRKATVDEEIMALHTKIGRLFGYSEAEIGAYLRKVGFALPSAIPLERQALTDKYTAEIKALKGVNPMPRTEAERLSFHERIFGKGSTPPLERLGRGQIVNDLLPMPPESGPPLPRALGLRWPWKK